MKYFFMILFFFCVISFVVWIEVGVWKECLNTNSFFYCMRVLNK